MFDTESEHLPPFKNVAADDVLEKHLSPLKTLSSTFHIRLLRELLQLRKFKNYATKEKVSLSWFWKKKENMLQNVHELQKFQQTSVSQFRYIEDKIDGGFDGQKSIPDGSESSSQKVEVEDSPTSQRVQNIPSGEQSKTGASKVSCDDSEVASLVGSLIEKGTLSANDWNGVGVTTA